MDTLLSTLSSLPFFKGMYTQQIQQILNHIDKDMFSVHEYTAGDIIVSECAICFIISGSADISVSPNNPTILRSIKAGEMFGAGMIYGNFTPETEVKAKVRTKVIMISKTALDIMIDESPQLAKNYIALLSDKIAYLNRRILMFTATGTDSKLALYLYTQAFDESGRYNENFTLTDTYTVISKKLDMGTRLALQGFG